jgi:superkiller protein 8
MSKQYLTVHTLDGAHPTDIYSLAATPHQLLSVSGASTILIHSTTSPEFPLVQSLKGAHTLGAHHICVSNDGRWAASAGFGGECKIWKNTSTVVPGEAPTEELGNAQWEEAGKIEQGKKAGELWAIALSAEGRYLAASAYDGRISVWDLLGEGKEKIREFETKGSFGLCVALVCFPGRFILRNRDIMS